MVSESESFTRRDRARLLWSFLASAILNLVAWVAFSGHISIFGKLERETPRESVSVAVSHIRVQRRAPQKPPKQKPQVVPHATPAPRKIARIAHPKTPPPIRVQTPRPLTAPLAPPPPASLALPRSWARQDFAFLGTTDAAEWLDWTKQGAKWVPHVFLWGMKVEGGYMRAPSLQDGVAQVLASLHGDARISTSKAQRVCSGTRDGWFLSYVKPEDDPPLHFDETLVLAGGKIYRAMYIREASQPEDRKTRDALTSLCWP